MKPLLCTSAHISAVSVLHGICLIAAAINSLFLLFYSMVGLGRYFTVVLSSKITFLSYLYQEESHLRVELLHTDFSVACLYPISSQH